MQDDEVDSIVTDPPYGLSFMGKDWDHGVPGVHFWQEALRIAKPGSHLLAFGGTRTYHRLVCAIEDAGWEIRDTIMWVYGSGFPKSHNLKDEWKGWGTALKPAVEPIVLARKPLIGTVAENVLKYGTGALNIDGCRVEGAAGSGVWGSSNATVDRERKFNRSPDMGEYRSEQHPQGRWPANLIHDGSEEVVDGFPVTQSGAMNSTAKGGQFNVLGKQYPRQVTNAASAGSASRFFYCAKASWSERNAGCEGMEKKGLRWSSGEQSPGTFQAEGTDRTASNHHPTVKPISLMEYLVRLITPPGGLVYDPFMGSGSTGIACVKNGYRFVGSELEAEYVSIAEKRIARWTPEATLFAQAASQ
jgi:site-specific DNA-methyltransferase (adenine-specific)